MNTSRDATAAQPQLPGQPAPAAAGTGLNMCSTAILPSGQPMPRLGYGTWKAEKGVTRKVVEQAIREGYRLIDCACDYDNEKEVGQGIKAAIDAGVCKREDLFVTSKLWNTFHAREHVEEAFQRSLSDLGLQYLDLYLIHFPISLKHVPIKTRYPPGWFDPKAEKPRMELDNIPIRETWEALEQLVDRGLIRNIGVSNFSCQLLMDLLKYARIRPAVNQIELHPYLVQEQLVRWHQHVGVVVTAYSPLGGSSYMSMKLAEASENPLEEPVILNLAKEHSKSPAQIILRWHLQRGYTVIPKSSKRERLLENKDIFDFSLSEAEMRKIAALDRNRRFNDPALYTPQWDDFTPIFV